MSDWEEAEELPVVGVAIPAAAGAWDDEDADEGDVKDSWDMDDEEETNGEAATSATAVKPKKKKTLAQRIAERKAEEERKKEEALKVCLECHSWTKC